MDLCYLGFFTVTLVIFLLFMYPDMEHPVLVHDASEIKITLHYITFHSESQRLKEFTRVIKEFHRHQRIFPFHLE